MVISLWCTFFLFVDRKQERAGFFRFTYRSSSFFSFSAIFGRNNSIIPSPWYLFLLYILFYVHWYTEASSSTRPLFVDSTNNHRLKYVHQDLFWNIPKESRAQALVEQILTIILLHHSDNRYSRRLIRKPRLLFLGSSCIIELLRGSRSSIQILRPLAHMPLLHMLTGNEWRVYLITVMLISRISITIRSYVVFPFQ